MMGRAVYDDGVLRITAMSTPPGLAIAGEIDESTYVALVDQLAEFASGAAEFHLNLAGVKYCDLAGLRAIVRLASVGRDVGHDSASRDSASRDSASRDSASRDSASHDSASRRVVLHNVPRQLRTALRIVGWDATPGLVVEGET